MPTNRSFREPKHLRRFLHGQKHEFLLGCRLLCSLLRHNALPFFGTLTVSLIHYSKYSVVHTLVPNYCASFSTMPAGQPRGASGMRQKSLGRFSAGKSYPPPRKRLTGCRYVSLPTA